MEKKVSLISNIYLGLVKRGFIYDPTALIECPVCRSVEHFGIICRNDDLHEWKYIGTDETDADWFKCRKLFCFAKSKTTAFNSRSLVK